jgi:hypothetical protein
VPILLTWAIVSFGVELEKIRFENLNIIFMYGKGSFWIKQSFLTADLTRK